MTAVSTVALSLPGAGSGWAPSTLTWLRTNPATFGFSVNSTTQLSPLTSP
jgi:hypothetical protein